jgi:hypothetical protein
MKYLLVTLALLALPHPARAQEVVTILDQKEWPVSGVGFGSDQYGTCAATDATHADAEIWLQVTETPGYQSFNDVRVMHPGPARGTAAVLQIGGERFVLGESEGDDFFSAAGDGGKIVAAMLRAPGLTLQFEGASAPQPYSYHLQEFPKAYAALVQHCHAPSNP